MPKQNKLKTPEWILKGYDSEADYLKAKGVSKKKTKSDRTAENLQANFGATKPETAPTRRKQKGFVGFKLRKCPECDSDDVGVVLTGEEGKCGGWECHKCKWKGRNIDEKELTEDEFMKYLDDKGEEI